MMETLATRSGARRLVERLGKSAAILAISTSAAYPSGADQNFDLACVVTANAVAVTSQNDSPEHRSAFDAIHFYLGRLSGRKPDIHWSAVALSKLVEQRSKANNADLFGACLKFLDQQLR